MLRLIEDKHLFGKGIGYNDVHLLATAGLTPDTTLWTLDKALNAASEAFDVVLKQPRVH